MLGISAEMSSITIYNNEALRCSCLLFSLHTSQMAFNILNI